MIKDIDFLDSDTRNFNKQADKIRKHIPIAGHITKNIAFSKSQDLIAVFELNGLLFESYEEDQLDIEADLLNKVIVDCTDENVYVQSHLIRRQQDYRYVNNDQGFLGFYHQEYNDIIGRENTYSNRQFIVFSYRIPALAKSVTQFSFLKKNKKENEAYRELMIESVRKFDELLYRFESTMGDYLPVRLESYKTNGITFSEIAELYNQLLNYEFRPIPLKEQNIDIPLANSQILFRHELGEIRNADKNNFFSVLGIKDYPSDTFAKMLSPFLSAPFEFNLTFSFDRINNEKAAEKLDLRQRQMIGAEDRAITLMNQLSVAVDRVSSGLLAMGNSNCSLVIYAKNPESLDRNVGEAVKYCSMAGFTPTRENLGLIGQYLSQLSGNHKEQLRRALISSENFCDFNPLYCHPYGQPYGNHWGDALMPIKTTADTIYYLNVHVDDVGSTNIMGMTGSGKTVLLTTMLIHSLKWEATHVLLDKDQGLKLAIEAIGGSYTQIESGVPTGWNPFSLSYSSSHFQYLKDWIILLLDREVSISEEEEIVKGIEHTYAISRDDKELCNIDSFINFLSDSKENSLTLALRKWSSEGEYGWVFANANDDISFEKGSINGFDLTEIFDNQKLRSAAIHYIIYRTKRLLDGNRVILWVDEFWQYLRDNDFNAYSIDILKTIRKKNGALITATQSPEDIAENANTDTFITQTATNIFLPNTKADEAQYKKVFKFSDSTWNYFSRLTKSSRRFIVQNELECARCKLDYSGHNKILAILSGTTKNINLFERLKEENNGLPPSDWIQQITNNTN